MATAIHPAVDGGVKAGKTDFAGGTLTCNCSSSPVTVTLKGNTAFNHVCGCSKCWKPKGALFSMVAVIPREKLSVTANGNKLKIVDDLELVAVSGHRQLLARNHRHHGEQRALGLPAFGASAYVVESRVALQGDGHGRGTAVAGERAAGEIALASLDAAIDGRMNRCSHDVLLVRL